MEHMINKLHVLLIALIFIFIPASVNAESPTVVVSEVAWMGTDGSANDEWIELKNLLGETIELTGWTLAAEDGTPNISLLGEIPPYAHFLLERTDNSTIPEMSSDLIYAGALGNGGERLILRDASGLVVDTVGSAGEWFAGNNTQKSTMVRQNELISGTLPEAWGDGGIGGTPQNSIVDFDGDGYGYSPNFDWNDNHGVGFELMREDCDDSRDFVYPTATETLDVRDNNCDGEVDEGFVLGQLQYEVHFTGLEVLTADSPSDNVSNTEQAILTVIDNAQHTLDIAVYDFTRTSIRDALVNAHDRGVLVRVVTNYGYDVCDTNINNNQLNRAAVKRVQTCEVMELLSDSGIEVRASPFVSYIQHNKFAVADSDVVLTGSTNWTTTGLTYNLNNVIVLYSSHIATAYKIEFSEMWGGRFATDKVYNTPRYFQFEQGTVEVRFSPSDSTEERLVELIDSAEESFSFGIFFWTSDTVGDLVLERYQSDEIDVWGVWDALGARNQYSVDDQLCAAGIPLRVENGGGKMHNKFAVVDPYGDTPQLLTGSYNWSNAGTNSNDENSLVFIGFPSIVQTYADYLDGVYEALPADTTCADHISAESGVAACGDRIDNDFDGDIDAADSDCVSSLPTTPLGITQLSVLPVWNPFSSVLGVWSSMILLSVLTVFLYQENMMTSVVDQQR